jgi:hypothetical protein
MSINKFVLRDAYESCSRSGGKGVQSFVTQMRHGLGLCDANGNDHKDANGNRKLDPNRQLFADNFSLREVAESILGSEGLAMLDPINGETYAKYVRAKNHITAASGGNQNAIFESTGIGLDPSAFININAYSILTGGLIEVKMLEGFNNPSFIGDQLMKTIPTKLNGQKIIGLNPIGDRAARRQPGQPHPRTQFGERWIQTPELRENALAIDVTKEAVFYDLTGDILSNAMSIGEELGYRKELEQLQMFSGVSNAFNWKGTAYNTYVAAAGNTLGYAGNLVVSDANPLYDWTSIQTAYLAFSRFTDPDTGKRILVNPTTLVVCPGKLATANLILDSLTTQFRTGGAQSSANPLYVNSGAGNPVSNFGSYKVLTSPLLEQELVTGGYTTAQATATWFLTDTTKAFAYMQAFPLTIQQAAPASYSMVDNGLVASYFGAEKGIPAVLSPWHTAKQTSAAS